jgi:hypothetical protein
MKIGLVVVLAVLWCACATPAPRPETRSALANLVLGQAGPPPTIGWDELERARVLLAEAKGELQPQQYELLEKDLVEAETAFQRFSTLAKAASKAAEVTRGAEALVGAQRALQIGEEIGALARAGPMLVALALLWPASTATQLQERPPLFVARIDLETSLQRLAVHAQQVAEQMKAAAPKKSSEPAREAAGRDKCGTCVCWYRGVGPKPLGQRPTRAVCREECKEDKANPANGMTCTGDKAIEWWN